MNVERKPFIGQNHKFQFDQDGYVRLEKVLWAQKIMMAPLKNGLSLSFIQRDIENAAISIQKTTVIHAWVHLLL